MKFSPHGYQKFSVKHILKNKYCALFKEMGLGKTVCALTAIDHAMYGDFAVNKVLVVAPKSVAINVWTAEIEKWDHLSHLTVSVITGTPAERTAAIRATADIYTIARDNVVWLVNQFQTSWPFDWVVLDEMSSFKSHKSQRFKALVTVRPFMKRVTGLTGTPAPNGLHDLWSQIYLLDEGKRLGRNITAYREAYLKPGTSNGHVVYKYDEVDLLSTEVYKRIEDICISMKAEDYLELPERVEVEHIIKMDPKTRKAYKDFEREQIMQIANKEITALNAAALTNKLLQFANGAMYDEDKVAHPVHDLKLDALEDLMEEAGTKQVLIFYSYQHDLKRIQKRFPNIKKLNTEDRADIKLWNSGKSGPRICHPASAGHGLNLQDGGSVIIWFGLNWSLELYQQANARLYRQGQKKPVFIYKILCASTMDMDVKRVLEGKSVSQNRLMEAVKAKIDSYNSMK